jgi:tetratricopeptide (TPR) repeat protein
MGNAAVEQNQIPRIQLGITEDDFMRMGAMGASFYERGDLERARIIFEGLVEIDPNSGDAHAALGALYTRTNKDDDALTHLNLAIQLDENMIAPYVNRAEVFIRQQKLEAAVEDIKKAVALDPEEKDPAANRARAMALGLYSILESTVNDENAPSN